MLFVLVGDGASVRLPSSQASLSFHGWNLLSHWNLNGVLNIKAYCNQSCSGAGPTWQPGALRYCYLEIGTCRSSCGYD